MSIFRDCAPPHIALPAAKNRRETSKTGRRPKRLAKLPENGIVATDANVYAEPTQENCSPCREATMVGKAVATAV